MARWQKKRSPRNDGVLAQGLGVEDLFKQSLNVVGGEGVELGEQGFAAYIGCRRARPSFQCRRSRLQAQGPRFFYLDSQARDRRLLEHRSHSQFHIKLPPDSRHYLQHQERVPAQLEKVLIHSYFFYL